MKKKILFRADGNSSIGLGHLYRLFSLVEIYKKKYDFVFLTKENSEISVIPDNYLIKLIPAEISYDKEPEWIKSNFNSESYIMIADGYQFKSDYQKSIKEQGIKLIYIDDLVQWHMYADVVINHSLGYKSNDYSSEDYTIFGLGSNYALLRPSFIEESKKNRIIRKVDSVFICFGGADPFDLTIEVVEALKKNIEIKDIHIVIGGAFKDKNKLEAIIKDNPRFKIHQNLSEKKMIEVMRSTNLAIAPSSTILYELCSVKMPILSGFYVDNQERIYKGFLDKGAIFGLGDISSFNRKDFEFALSKFFKTNNIESYCKAQLGLFDGKIEERFLNIIEE